MDIELKLNKKLTKLRVKEIFLITQMFKTKLGYKQLEYSLALTKNRIDVIEIKSIMEILNLNGDCSVMA